MSRRHWLFGLLLLALVASGVRIAIWTQLRDSPGWQVFIGDAGRYHAWATQLAAGDWLGSGVFYQAPLYPYALASLYALTGPDAVLARGVQALLGVLASLLLASATANFFGRAAGLAAGAVMALWPAELFHETLIEKAGLGTLLTAALLRCLGSTLRSPLSVNAWLLGGVTLGLLVLVRENALLLAPVLLSWAIWHPRRPALSRVTGVTRARFRMQGAGLLLLGLSLTLAPVLLRNRLIGGEWRLTTAQFGPNFYIGNNALADGTYTALLPEHGTPAHEQSDATQIASDAAGRPLSAGEVDAWWTRRTLRDIADDPPRWLRLCLQKLALTWTSVEIADSEDQYTAGESSPVLGTLTRVLPFGLLAAAAAGGGLVLGPALRRAWVLPAIIATYTLSVVLFYVFARYRLPLVPVLALVAGGGLVRCVTLLRRGGWPRVAAGVLAGAAAFCLTLPACVGPWFPDWPDLSVDRMRGVTQFNLALRFWDQAAPAELVDQHLARCVSLHPDYASAWLYWGHVLVDRNERTAAVAKFARAAALDPRGADIRVAAGENLLILGRPAEALPLLEQAVALTSDDPHAQYLYGRSLYLIGNRSAAIAPLQAAVTLDPEYVLPRRLLAITLDQLGQSLAAEAQFRELQRRLPKGAAEAEWIERRLGQRRSLLRQP